MICLFHFPSLQPCVDTTFFASMQSFIHTTFEVASMQLHRRKVASMRLFQNCTEHSTFRLCRACARRVEWTSKWANINERCHYFSHRAEPRPAPVRPDEIFCGGVELIRAKVRRHRSNFINCQFKSASSY